MKNKLQIILHCLPREIDEVERICNHLQRSSHLLNKDDEVILDFTLNISDKLTDWKNLSELIPKEFINSKSSKRFQKMSKKRNFRKVEYPEYIYIYIYIHIYIYIVLGVRI